MESKPVNSQNQRSTGAIIALILKALAVAMAVGAVVLNILNLGTAQTQLALLGLGLFCLAVTSLRTD